MAKRRVAPMTVLTVPVCTAHCTLAFLLGLNISADVLDCAEV